MKSAKKYILEYVCLKILKGSYEVGDIICSENKFALRFNCSRLTVRSALVSLVNSGILYSKKGKGYVVAPNSLDVLFYARKLSLIGDSHVSKRITNKNVKKMFDLDDKKFELFAAKTFYNKKLISISFICINKVLMKNYFDAGYDFINDTIMQLIDTSFVPNSIESSFVIKDIIPEIKNDLLKLGYHNAAPFVKQVMYDNNEYAPYFIYSVPKKDMNNFYLTISLSDN